MRTAVVGAGPSGMMAAYVAAKKSEVVLFEKNEKIGKKLYITGKGRCNITNDRDISEFFEQVSRNEKFLYSAFYSFTNKDMVDLLNKNGLRTKVERGGRVFPTSDKSSDVIKTYEKLLKSRNVLIKLNKEIKTIIKVKDKFLVDNENFDNVIIATGGYSYKSTGSTGDGYKFAKKFGLEVTKLYPALTGISLKDKFLEQLQGLSLKNVSLIARNKKKIISEEFGECMFSHFGITGPIVLRTSNIINRIDNVSLFLDFKTALSKDELDKRFIREFEENQNKELQTIMFNMLPKKLVPIVLEKIGINEHKKANEITKNQRYTLVDTIKNFPLEYNGLLDINTSIVTSGGVSVNEINPSTMESKKVEGLYFCGEVLDVDAFTGGFNMQIANSTGYLAGNAILDKIK